MRRAALLLGVALGCGKGDRSEVGLADASKTAGADVSTDTAAARPVAGQPKDTGGPGTAAVDREATTALEKMGTYLRSLKSFQVKATTTRDEVSADGQKIQFASTADMLVQRPNRMRAELTSDAQHRLFFYDGKTFTIWADLPGYYASVPAPATLSELSDRLEEKFSIELPLRDLFLWGSDRSKIDDLKAAVDIGPSQVQGTTVEHFAFRQNGLDWQIWIQKGDYPLPRKLVITTLTDDARPDYTAVLDWNLAPSFNDAAFGFDPPSGAKRIILTQTDTLAGRM
jgi:hypothetical protein